ncbi:MAG: chaperonin GroEL [Anaerolineae bacterium]|nr:chaperonin GroEL [Anaerolineae bacterium]
MAKSKDKWQAPAVVFQPEVHQAFQSGFHQIISAIRPTLGPFPRMTLYDATVGMTQKPPEILDDGGTIARRILQIPGRDQDVGAMLVRNVLWKMREQVGDGTATAAVIFEAAYNAGLHYIAAGGNAMQLRTYILDGLRDVLDELEKQAFEVTGKNNLVHLATAVSQDAELGKILGEIFDIIGAYGRLEIRDGQYRQHEREYVEGMYWPAGLLSRDMMTNIQLQRAEAENAAILISDAEIEDPRDLVPVLGICVKTGIKDLVIVARKISEICLGMIALNKRKGRIDVNVVGAKTPGMSADNQRMALSDMALLTGGSTFMNAAGESIRNVKPDDLGRARRVLVDRYNMNIIGGQGDPRELRRYIAQLREAYHKLSNGEERDKLEERIGKLMGGSATLRIGGLTETNLKQNKAIAERAAEAMRGAIREGVLPGGGMAYMACLPMIQARMETSQNSAERAAYHVIGEALEAPLRTLLINAGYEPGAIVAQLRGLAAGEGFDVVAGKVVNLQEAGILDIATVVKAAVLNGVGGATMALTTDVVVHRSKAPEELNT